SSSKLLLNVSVSLRRIGLADLAPKPSGKYRADHVLTLEQPDSEFIGNALNRFRKPGRPAAFVEKRIMSQQRRVLVLSALGLAALAGAPVQAAEAGKLTIWYSVEGAKGMAKIGEEFTKATGVPVSVEAPEDTPAKFQQ